MAQRPTEKFTEHSPMLGYLATVSASLFLLRHLLDITVVVALAGAIVESLKC